MNRLKLLVAAVASAGFCGTASAAVVDNSPLVDPPGVYFGSGNPNTNFTVNNVGNIEIGLSAIERFLGPVVPVGDVYTVPTGPTGVSGQTGVNWGIDFSVNLRAFGGTLNLSNITTKLTVADQVNTTTGSFDPLLVLTDNFEFGPSNAQNCKNVVCDPTTNWAFQNSEPGDLIFFLNDPLFNMNQNDLYTVTLEVLQNGDSLGSDTIFINAVSVPEPVTLSLFGAGLVGAATLRRRKKNKQN